MCSPRDGYIELVENRSGPARRAARKTVVGGGKDPDVAGISGVSCTYKITYLCGR